MGLFGKKKAPGEAAAAGQPGAAIGGEAGDRPVRPAPSPEKAAKFFDHARTAFEATNYEWSMHLWLNGLRQSPGNMPALEGFFKAATEFNASPAAKKGLSKETLKDFQGRDDVERYLSGILQWSVKPADPILAARAAELAQKADLNEPAHWIALRAFGANARDKKPRKDLFLRLMEVFSKLGDFERAVESGSAALRLDPADGPLSTAIRNLSAQATMSKGGYDQTGQAGGYRSNIRDADKQRMLEDQDRISKTEEAIDRLVASAEQEYRAKPDDQPTILNYAKRLVERGKPEDENRAFTALETAYTKTKQFRFRQMAGEIRVRRARRRLAELKIAAEADPTDAAAQEAYRTARAAFIDLETKELKLQVEAYPTDLTIKFELGKRYFEAARYEDAIANFQEAQNEARSRVPAMNFLGRSFISIGWVDEAVHTYRRAMEVHRTHQDETGMELRYWLMAALQLKGEQQRDLAAAEEADKLASSIAVQQINFKDIRARRDALKQLIAELKRGDAA